MDSSITYERPATNLAELLKASALPECFWPAAQELHELYDESLPYHNTQHALDVTQRTLELCDQYDVHGYERWAVTLAAIGHDALYHLPLEDNFASKEQRSGYAAYRIIRRTPETDEIPSMERFALTVAGLIESTYAETEPRNLLEVILNAADLSGISGEPTEVLANTGKLFVEHLMLQGEELVGDAAQVISTHTDTFNGWLASGHDHLVSLVECKLSSVKERAEKAVANIGRISLENVLGSLKPRKD